MLVAAPARLLDVYCPVSGHIVFQAAAPAFGTTIAKICKCGRLVFGTHRDQMQVVERPRR